MLWVIRLLALMLTAAALDGCVYDAYTGTYVPCCGYYGNPYYRYPYYRPPPAPYGYPSGPYMAPPQGEPGAYPSPPAQQPFRPGAGRGEPDQRIVAADGSLDTPSPARLDPPAFLREPFPVWRPR